jgi:integrase
LATFAHPHIGNQAIAEVDVPSVLKVLEPIWASRPETASRLRGRLEVILDWAKVKGLREGENPARWKGNLDQVLPKKGKIRKTRHHAAIDYTSVPAFFATIRGIEIPTSLALQFLILTAARTGEVIGAQWDEVDINAAVWTIAPERMKAGREHRVPLTRASINVLHAAKRLEHPGTFIFPGRKPRPQLSNMAMLKQVKRFVGATTHGFRSSFRDWAAETTSTPSEVVEMAPAHAIENRVEAAYRRGDLLEKRRALMDAWATYCLTPKQTIVGTAEK